MLYSSTLGGIFDIKFCSFSWHVCSSFWWLITGLSSIICIDQSEASIQVTWSISANQKPSPIERRIQNSYDHRMWHIICIDDKHVRQTINDKVQWNTSTLEFSYQIQNIKRTSSGLSWGQTVGVSESVSQGWQYLPILSWIWTLAGARHTVITHISVSCPQLRFERHPRVHKLFLNMWGRRIIADNARSFCTPSFYQIKPPATTPCKNLRTPHLFQYVLMRFSQILVVCLPSQCTMETQPPPKPLPPLTKCWIHSALN